MSPVAGPRFNLNRSNLLAFGMVQKSMDSRVSVFLTASWQSHLTKYGTKIEINQLNVPQKLGQRFSLKYGVHSES
jgi:hypothetical protein